MLLILGLSILLVGYCYGMATPDENSGIDDPELFQGDMILEPMERLRAELGMDVSAPEQTRGSTFKRLWPRGIVHYEINATLASSSKAVNAIKAGMKLWSDKTCIKFVPRTNQRAYVHIFQGKGCSSVVGRIGRRQRLSLARGCWFPGIVAHELAHALGFHHEQSRPDRDDYVTINFKNIKAGKARNFKKYTVSKINSLGTPYDYLSIMHYRGKAFSKNKLPTIVPKKSGVKLGNRRAPSTIDINQMNLLYKCL